MNDTQVILTSDVSKEKVCLSKILTSLAISCIFGLFYVLVLTLIYLVLSGDAGMSLMALRYALPITAFPFIFALWV